MAKIKKTDHIKWARMWNDGNSHRMHVGNAKWYNYFLGKIWPFFKVMHIYIWSSHSTPRYLPIKTYTWIFIASLFVKHGWILKTWINLKIIILSERNQTKRQFTQWFHWYKILENPNYSDTESSVYLKWGLKRGQDRDEWEDGIT